MPPLRRLAALVVSASLAVGTMPLAAASAHAAAPRQKADSAGRSFTIAVMPDTQQEVFGSDPRMRQRSQSLADRRAALKLKYVTHVGDVTNWGWLAPSQLTAASEGMRPLERAGIPYSLSIGNHDTRAVGWDGQGNYGGGAYVSNPECVVRLSPAECRTSLLVRRTDEFNRVFTASRYGAVGGAFEPGKIDNIYSTFNAGGLRWMVLNLEVWPRATVVSWARRVVAAHPRHNVIIATHSYLTARGGISTSSEYGSTSPKYLWDNLVSRYRNIKLVLSGHTGAAASRVDTGRARNKVVSLLTSFHSNTANPVRIVRFNPANGNLFTRIESPNGRGESYSRYRLVVRGMGYVR